MPMKIEFDKESCIGCGACASVCADNWDIVDDGGSYKAKPLISELDEIGCNKEAAEVCPVKAIKLVDLE